MDKFINKRSASITPSQEKLPEKREDRETDLSEYRDALKQVFPRRASKTIDALTQEQLAVMVPHIDRLKDARALGLIFSFSVDSLEPILKLSSEEFSLLQTCGGKFSPETLDELTRYPRVLAALRPDDPRFPIAEILLSNDRIGAIQILAAERYYKPILDQQDPRAYIVQRLELLERYKKLHPRQHATFFIAFIKLNESKVARLEKLQDSEVASVFAETMMEAEMRNESLEEFAERIRLWQTLFTPEILGQITQQRKKPQRFDLYKLVAARVSWTRALLDMDSVEGFRQYLLDPAAVRSFIEAGVNAEIIHKLDLDRVKTWDARTEIPIIETVSDPVGQQVKDILEMTGLTRILKKCVEDIEIVPPSDMGAAAGAYSGSEAKIRFTGQRDPSAKKLLPGTVIHETGHAVQNLLGSKVDGQSKFDSYVAGIVYRDLAGVSDYPEAFGKMVGRESYVFLRESFAEDFRVFLQNPELIPPQRRANMETMFSAALPDIDVEALRGNIRRMYGVLYGVSVNDVQRLPECKAVEEFARFLDRINSEKERAKKSRSQK